MDPAIASDQGVRKMPDNTKLTEEDIKLRYITPAIQKKWKNENILMEAQITAGRINLTEKFVKRDAPKKADYLLLLRPNHPIAVVEAKDNRHSVSHGMQQAKEYAMMLDVPFAFSSNGDAFEEFDAITGKEREIPLGEFPSPDELYQRYKKEKGLTADEEKIINQPYYTSQSTNAPRYYQRVAINRTLDAIARGQNRILLVMATGTGKTYTAFQIVYRLIKSGLRHKVLYLADRNILVDQSISQDFKPLEKTIHKINFTNEDPTTITSYEVYFSLYQQLAGDGEEVDDEEDAGVNEESGSGAEADDEAAGRLASLFRPDFFDLVIVDECHRGSAKKDSSWRKILDYFSSATQIGMTATPKETKYVSNIDYFGEPVYTYSLRAGIDDGFLAPFRVINVKTDIGEGWRPTKGQKDKSGKEIEDRIYTNKDFDYNIVLEDRTQQVAKEITAYLKATGRMQKTIVFCATEDHAERMRVALANLNADMVRENPDYVVRITGSDSYGKDKLDYFISVSDYPVIATTSKLLSTGVDCKMTKLIVLDQMISSMTTFKQIIGRGTRIRENDGKTYFVVMDFRNVTRLFADPDWDGPVEQTDGFDPDAEGRKNPREPGREKKQHPIVDENGCRVQVTDKAVQLFDSSGKLVREESITDYAKSTILGTYSNLDDFISKWSAEEKKYVIRQRLIDRGIDIGKIKKDMDMDGVSDYDFICHLAFNAKPLTRKERADRLKKRDFLNQYSGHAREVLEELLSRYEDTGIYDIEKPEVLKLPQFARFGKPAKIAQLFGGKGGYHTAIKKLETELYNDSGAEHK